MEFVTSFQAHESYVLGLRFADEGRCLYSSGMDNVVRVWTTDGWQLQRTFDGHTKSVNCFALTPDEAMLVTGSSDTTVRLWDTTTGETVRVLQDRKRVVSALSLSADGAWIAAGSYKGRVSVWSMSGEVVAAFPASKQNLSAAAISPADRGVLATSGQGPTVHVWEVPSGRAAATLEAETAAVMRLGYTPDGAGLVALTYEGLLHAWDAGAWRHTDQALPSVPQARAFAFDVAGARVALLAPGLVQIYAFPGWELLDEQPVAAKVLNAVAFSPSGNLLAVGAADRMVRLWKLA